MCNVCVVYKVVEDGKLTLFGGGRGGGGGGARGFLLNIS